MRRWLGEGFALEKWGLVSFSSSPRDGEPDRGGTGREMIDRIERTVRREDRKSSGVENGGRSEVQPVAPKSNSLISSESCEPTEFSVCPANLRSFITLDQRENKPAVP